MLSLKETNDFQQLSAVSKFNLLILLIFSLQVGMQSQEEAADEASKPVYIIQHHVVDIDLPILYIL